MTDSRQRGGDGTPPGGGCAEVMASVMLRSAWAQKERGIKPALH